MTSDAEIMEWIQTGKNMKCSHVLIVRKGRVTQHYPIFVRGTEDVDAKIRAHNGPNDEVVDRVIPL